MGASTILRTAAVAALLIGSISRAHADGAVLVVGTVSSRDRDVIVDAIQGAGSALSLRFSATAGRDTADASVACLHDKTPWSCVAPVIRGKDQLVIVEVNSERGGGAPMTIVTAHLLTAGDEAESFVSRNCAMCNEDALKRTVGDLSRDLLQRAAARSGRTRLTIRSRPDRAQIVLDGEPAGATDTTLATYPGKHTIELRAPGYAAATHEAIAVDGRTIDVAIPLHPEARGPGPGDPGSPDPHPGSRLLPGIAIGAGAAAIVAGGLLIAFDQDPSPQKRYYYNTAPYGVASLAAGVVVAGAGIYFWLRPRASSAAAVAPIPGGAAISWAGRF